MTALPATIYSLRYERRPPTLNVERQQNRFKRAKWVKEWREEFARLATVEGVPRLGPVEILARPELRHRGSVPDTGACIGAAKAAVDGLVDAGVLAEDGPAVVRHLGFDAPVVTGVDALVIEIWDLGVVA